MDTIEDLKNLYSTISERLDKLKDEIENLEEIRDAVDLVIDVYEGKGVKR